MNSAIGMARVALSASIVSTCASSTRMATAMSDGFTAMHWSLAPSTAWIRLKPAERRTARARVALVARLRHIVEVVATRPLQQVAAGGGLVPQLRACPRQQRPAEDPVALPHTLVRRQIAIPHHRADAQASFRGIFDLIQRKSIDIDDMALASRPGASSESSRFVPPAMSLARGSAEAAAASVSELARDR